MLSTARCERARDRRAAGSSLHGRATGRKAGVIKPRLYLIPDGYPRSFSVGRGPTSSAVVLSLGLLTAASPAELEGLVAHELAHVRNHDVAVQTTSVAVSAHDHRDLADRRFPPAGLALLPRSDRRRSREPSALAEARVRGRHERRRISAARPTGSPTRWFGSRRPASSSLLPPARDRAALPDGSCSARRPAGAHVPDPSAVAERIRRLRRARPRLAGEATGRLRAGRFQPAKAST